MLDNVITLYMPCQQYVTLSVRMEGLALHLMNVVVQLDGVETHVHKVR